MSAFWSTLLWFIAGGAVGAIISFFATKKHFQKELAENPPVNRDMIRAMYMQMGRKPSEAQINQVMKSMNSAYSAGVKKDEKKKKK